MVTTRSYWRSKQFLGSVVSVIFSLAVGMIAMRWIMLSSAPRMLDSREQQSTTRASLQENASIVTLPNELWAPSAIEIQPAVRGDFSRSVRLTGRVGLNEDRIAHVFPMVEGSVQSVHVQLGQMVRADDLLVVIHSRDIGQAKLELYQARLQLEFAQMKDARAKTMAANTSDLITALRANVPIDSIEAKFRDRSMGDYRQTLLAAYANLYKSQADFARLDSLTDRTSIPEKQFVSAEAIRNADRATFQASLEQIAYDLQNTILTSSQSVRESETRVAVSETKLRILGYRGDDLQNVNPATEGEAISHYPIRAPFDGTIISKDVVLLEHTRLGVQLLSIADLSTVWITADVYEENLPLLNASTDKEILVRNEAWPDRTFSAKVFYTGEIMDESSRTIAMRAIATNVDHLLKPGMFVNVELPGMLEKSVLRVPATAVQEHEGSKFVFVHKGDEVFERRDIKVGRKQENIVEVLDGLATDEPVVVTGGFFLKSRLLAELMGE